MQIHGSHMLHKLAGKKTFLFRAYLHMEKPVGEEQSRAITLQIGDQVMGNGIEDDIKPKTARRFSTATSLVAP
uniref:Uncharacterized protein n=1 Tax=Thermosporothrix sp. COM3 TaxID=2490863 RepID=A0A455SV18_9CHLR|nr:hypothetical protein KTC_37450 [Thermosporothrix sp. COM3]